MKSMLGQRWVCTVITHSGLSFPFDLAVFTYCCLMEANSVIWVWILVYVSLPSLMAMSWWQESCFFSLHISQHLVTQWLSQSWSLENEGWMNECVHSWFTGRTDKWMVDGWVGGWMDWLVYREVDDHTRGWVNGRLHGQWVDGEVHYWTPYVFMDRQMCG